MPSHTSWFINSGHIPDKKYQSGQCPDVLSGHYPDIFIKSGHLPDSFKWYVRTFSRKNLSFRMVSGHYFKIIRTLSGCF
ncbi:hypothetical protein P378_20035 [Desulforamulus profundi]|uniref:Uncharacterized protein n=1 Tax=Desulforamulus profundi TaxID=1383067 RepID=A0A2C6MBJ9_9FIRM|nr:hypothetical protein P378_20035 [Desulforamulus profundi]